MQTTCERCGTFLTDPATILYSDAGDPMCFECRERIDEARRDETYARRLVGTATGALFSAVIGLPIAFFFVVGAMFFSVPAIGVAWRLLKTPQTERAIAGMGVRWRYVRFACIAALVIGGLGVALMIFNFANLNQRSAWRPLSPLGVVHPKLPTGSAPRS